MSEEEGGVPGPQHPSGNARQPGRRAASRRGRTAFVDSSLRGIALVVFALAGGCNGPFGPSSDDAPPAQITELPRNLTSGELASIHASNRFGFELLREVADDDRTGNLFLSPLSASMALGMTLNGADGATFDAMRAALRLDELPESEINASYEGLLDLLSELDPHVELAVGNAVWHRADMTVREAFRERVERHFGARVEELDFSDPDAVGIMNAWSRDVTRGRIDEIIDSPIPGNIVAFVMNAVYFKAGWTEPFDPERTRLEPFHRPDGSNAPVEFMVRDDTVSYYRGEDYDAVDLLYAGGAFSMTVVVPREGETDLAGLIEGLDLEGWNEMVSGLRTNRVQLWLPRFELEWEGILNDPLKALGMGVAFQPGADFSRMFESGSPWIDEVKQKSFIRVDEEGTEAAAVTSVAMATSLPRQLRADRPFLFALRERYSGTILFLGSLSDPPPP